MADRRAEKLVTGAALALLALSAAGCTEGSPKAGAPSAPAKAPAPKGADEAAQGARAQAALELLAPGVEDDEPDGPRFVESGVERVVEGLHNLSRLKQGKPYQLYVACVGKGAVKVVVADAPARTVPCDGTPAAQRIVDVPADLRLDIAGVNGATGMVAWEIAALSPDGGVRVQ